MFFTLGRQELFGSVTKLCGSPEKGAYVDWLSKKIDPCAIGSGFELVDDSAIERTLIEPFLDEIDPAPGATPLTASFVDECLAWRNGISIRQKLDRLSVALGDLGRRDADLLRAFKLVINRIFVFEIDGEIGGSDPRTTGVIWSNPPESATRWDLVEVLTHELTHHSLFIDEQVHGHYRRCKDLMQPISAVRNRPRPLRAVVHSLVVATEILALRAGDDNLATLHPRTEPLLKSCERTIHSILKHPDWEKHFRPRGREIFEACRAICAEHRLEIAC